jgi:hypothetical protein
MMQPTLYYLNCQDLFIFMDKYRGQDLLTMSETDWQLLSASFKENKPLQKVIELATGIKLSNPDIIALVEVGGEESLTNFNQHFLDDAYQVFFTPTNSDRGIDYGFLVKKSLASQCELKSYRDKAFARALQCLNLNDQLKIFLIHMKSKLNLKGSDFEGRTQRQKEVAMVAKILAQYNTPYVLCGDFNGLYDDQEGEPEYAPLRKLDLINPLPGVVTFYYFDKFEARNPYQLDYCLVQRKNRSIIAQIEVSELFDTMQNPYPTPEKLDDKRLLPSDHYPLIIKFELTK